MLVEEDEGVGEDILEDLLGRRREEEAEGESERDRLAEGRSWEEEASFEGELGVEEMEVDSTAGGGDPGRRTSPPLSLLSVEEAGRRGKAST